MAYTTGTADSMADLRSKIVAACQSGGWSWDTTNEVIHGNGCFVQLTAQSATVMALRGRTSVSDGVAATSSAYMCRNSTLGDWAWPVTYTVFCFAAEVFVVINTQQDYYQWLAWGTSIFAAALPGSGAWYAGSVYGTSFSLNTITSAYGGSSSSSTSYATGNSYNCGLFWGAANGFVHHGITPATPWTGSIGGCPLINDLINVLPNSWNDEVVLLPVRLVGPLIQSRYALTLELQNARYTRIDWYEPGEIVTIGQDKWKIFPFFKKNTQYRNGTSGAGGGGGSNHSGTLAMAIRYDGT